MLGDAPAAVHMKLELIVLPVKDVDRAKAFYSRLGWHCDIDHTAETGIRIVQFTPPGSDTSIMLGAQISAATPGSVQGLHISVSDIEDARDNLIQRGIAVSELFHDDGGIFHRSGPEGHASGPNPEHKSYASYASFSDPDGNTWVMQEITARLGADLRPGDSRFTRQLVNAALGIPN
jgi:predicted enzyme related to lactoylglutathione lyase